VRLVLPCGESAVLVEVGSLHEVHALQRAVQSTGLAVDAVPGWRTLLVTTDGPLGRLVELLEQLQVEAEEPEERAAHLLPVVYDGPDLDDVARSCGLSRDEVVQLHGSTMYTVAFLGFSRGFPYLAGLPEALHLPHRSSPRPRVPAGSVGIALDQCGIYPVASPGGWHLIGRTTSPLFEPDRDPPSLLSPGDAVRFHRVTA